MNSIPIAVRLVTDREALVKALATGPSYSCVTGSELLCAYVSANVPRQGELIRIEKEAKMYTVDQVVTLLDRRNKGFSHEAPMRASITIVFVSHE